MADEGEIVELVLDAKTFGLIYYLVLLEPGSATDGFYAP